MKSPEMGSGSPENEPNKNEQMLPHEESEKPRKPFETTKIGLYNEKFKMSEAEFSETKTAEVRGREASFEITAGPLVWEDEPLKETYVLEIHYSAEGHRKDLPLEGFGQHLYADYAEKAHDLATEFCSQNGFQINTHINSWPEFQAVISKIRTEIKPER